jgi:hypothetical protein
MLCRFFIEEVLGATGAVRWWLGGAWAPLLVVWVGAESISWYQIIKKQYI